MKVIGKVLLTIGFLISAVVVVIFFLGEAQLYTTEKILPLLVLQACVALLLILVGATLIGWRRFVLQACVAQHLIVAGATLIGWKRKKKLSRDSNSKSN